MLQSECSCLIPAKGYGVCKISNIDKRSANYEGVTFLEEDDVSACFKQE